MGDHITPRSAPSCTFVRPSLVAAFAKTASMIPWSAAKRCLPFGVRCKRVDSSVVMFVPVIQPALANRWIRRSMPSEISLSVIVSRCVLESAGKFKSSLGRPSRQKSAGQGEPGRRGGVVSGSGGGGLAATPGAGAGGQGDAELGQLIQVETGHIGSAEFVLGDGPPVGFCSQPPNTI